jgi:hypothetical protein
MLYLLPVTRSRTTSVVTCDYVCQQFFLAGISKNARYTALYDVTFVMYISYFNSTIQRNKICLFAKAVKNDRVNTDATIRCSNAMTAVKEDFFTILTTLSYLTYHLLLSFSQGHEIVLLKNVSGS